MIDWLISLLFRFSAECDCGIASSNFNSLPKLDRWLDDHEKTCERQWVLGLTCRYKWLADMVR